MEVFESVKLITTPGFPEQRPLPLAVGKHQFEIVRFGEDATEWVRFTKNDKFGLKVEGNGGLRDLEERNSIEVTKNGKGYFT